MSALLLRCDCMNVLATYQGSYWLIKHKRRTILARQLVAITCEDCRRLIVVDPEGLLPGAASALHEASAAAP